MRSSRRCRRSASPPRLAPAARARSAALRTAPAHSFFLFDLQRLESFNEIPDYNSYLTYVLTQLPGESELVRSMAGLLLKTNIRIRFSSFPVEVVAYIKANIFSVIGDPLSMIRNTVGTVIDTLIVELGPANWPEALSTLMELVDSPEQLVQEVRAPARTRDGSN